MLLGPWIVFSVPREVFFGLGIVIILVIVVVGLLGMVASDQRIAGSASLALLVMIITGKVGTDVVRAPAPDTLALLSQFVAVIFFMEASRVVLSYDRERSELGGRTDEMSQAVREKLRRWVGDQLSRQARLVTGSLGLSLALLVFGGFTSISVNQVSFSAVLVLLVVGALLFLITQRREPETRTAELT